MWKIHTNTHTCTHTHAHSTYDRNDTMIFKKAFKIQIYIEKSGHTEIYPLIQRIYPDYRGCKTQNAYFNENTLTLNKMHAFTLTIWWEEYSAHRNRHTIFVGTLLSSFLNNTATELNIVQTITPSTYAPHCTAQQSTAHINSSYMCKQFNFVNRIFPSFTHVAVFFLSELGVKTHTKKEKKCIYVNE